MKWRVAAHQGKTQAQLNSEFATVVETYQKNANSSSGSSSKSKKSRRTKKSGDSGSNKTRSSGGSANKADSDNEKGSGTDDDAAVTRKRIRLQESRRVVTEERNL